MKIFVRTRVLLDRREAGYSTKCAYRLVHVFTMMVLVACVLTENAWSKNIPIIEASQKQSPSYIGRSGDAYLYEKVPSGDATKPEHVLVWYMGKQANGPLIRYQDGAMVVTLECYEDCQYVRWTSGEGGRKSSGGRIRVINDPLIYSIIRDATSGLLN